MSCTKAQLLALLSMIEDKLKQCKSVECCISIIQTFKEVVAEKTYREIQHVLFK